MNKIFYGENGSGGGQCRCRHRYGLPTVLPGAGGDAGSGLPATESHWSRIPMQCSPATSPVGGDLCLGLTRGELRFGCPVAPT